MKDNIAIVDIDFPFHVNEELFFNVKPYSNLPLWKMFFFRLFHIKQNEVEKQNWVNELATADFIILFDTHKNYAYLADKIEKKYPDKKLVFYAWNPLIFSNDWKLLSSKWEKLSFSKADCVNTSFEYAGTFYGIPKEICDDTECKWDAFFVGLDKGRRSLIGKIQDMLSSAGLISKIIIVDNKKCLYNHKFSRYLEYDEVCRYIKYSKAIVDIVQEGQEGMTIRIMEGLFYNKKVITTNKNVKYYDFYDKSNFFIYGLDDQTKINEFMNTPFVLVPYSIKTKYQFDNWLKKIIGM